MYLASTFIQGLCMEEEKANSGFVWVSLYLFPLEEKP